MDYIKKLLQHWGGKCKNWEGGKKFLFYKSVVFNGGGG